MKHVQIRRVDEPDLLEEAAVEKRAIIESIHIHLQKY